jgi:hypothetical protein
MIAMVQALVLFEISAAEMAQEAALDEGESALVSRKQTSHRCE